MLQIDQLVDGFVLKVKSALRYLANGGICSVTYPLMMIGVIHWMYSHVVDLKLLTTRVEYSHGVSPVA